MTNPDAAQKINTMFARTTDEILSLKEWEKLLNSGKKLRIKYGVDVTAPYLHTGHAVNLWMMRSLQDLGHKVIFLVGDFTTQIGDPTGKNKTRPIISQKDIERNTQKFIEQAEMILRFDDPELLEIRKNSEWFNKMPMGEFLKLLSLVTHNKLISREMFRQRIKNHEDLYMHELIYPILQGYDSVVLESDLTIIGSDQLFNEMIGRFYQEKFGQTPQVIITTKITPGVDGGEKQSKSLGNYIGLGHSPRDKFGITMRLPDNLIQVYLEVYTDISGKRLDELCQLVKSNPLEAKKQLAKEIVRRYHGEEVACHEYSWFNRTFSQGKVPKDIPYIKVEKDLVTALDMVIKFFDGTESKSYIRKLFMQGAIKCNGNKIDDFKQTIEITSDMIFSVGKRKWFKVCLK